MGSCLASSGPASIVWPDLRRALLSSAVLPPRPAAFLSEDPIALSLRERVAGGVSQESPGETPLGYEAAVSSSLVKAFTLLLGILLTAVACEGA